MTKKVSKAKTAWGDPGQRARRREAATQRKEAAAEKRKLKNERTAAKTKIRAQNGGAGFKIVFFRRGRR